MEVPGAVHSARHVVNIPGELPMKLNLENLDITSFPTTEASTAAPSLRYTGEDCWSFRVCLPTRGVAGD